MTVITIHGAKRDDSNELPGGRIFTNDMYSQDDLGAILLIEAYLSAKKRNYC